jgi:integrase
MAVTGHIRLQQGKRGSTYYAKYRLPNGKQVQAKLGPAHTGPGRPPTGYYTKRTAQEALAAILTDARRGTLAAHDDKLEATFADAAAEYLRFVQDVRQRETSTVGDYKGVIDGYLLAEFGPMPLETITADDVDRYKERLIAEGRLSNRTIVRHLMVLNGIFKRAKRVWKITNNPASAELVERPQVVYTGEFETLDRDGVLLLAANAADKQDATLYLTAGMTGLRQGELLGLQWRDVDFVDVQVHVRRNWTDRTLKIPKGKKVRSVPMVPEVADALARLKEREHFTDDDDLVFCSEVGEFMDSWAMRRRFYKALEHAGLPRVVFHSLRHCFGTHGIRAWDPNTLQGYMGHQHYSTTARYLHHRPAAGDAAKLAAAFSGQTGDKMPVAPVAAEPETGVFAGT